ncbi:hypothetical protein [Kitasatospora sp. LaBMicrA B282]|uniref:hypothetical protein n=1 Tax=Kitasatospora sp. LaBMicrA B282 TaxID=3420949 RepID=UPI003D0C9945
MRGLPLLVLLAARPDSGTQVEPLLEQLAAQSHCRPVELPPLAADSVASLVRTRLGEESDPRFAAACAEATRGNPLLLRELLRTLADHGVRPAGDQAPVVEEFRGRILAGTVIKRLAGEPEPVGALVRALVVLGDGADCRGAAELAGLAAASARETGRRLQRIGVLASGGTARFEHPWSAPRSPKPWCGPWSRPTDMPGRPNCSGARGRPKPRWRPTCCWPNRTVSPGGWTSCARRRGQPAAEGHPRSP